MNVDFDIVIGKPPAHLWDRIVERFGIEWGRVIVTYGQEVFTSGELPEDLIVHEGVHVQQQMAYGKDLWWDRYLTDDVFRLTQELEAYRAQWQFLASSVKDRNTLAWHLARISGDLSSELYGRIVTSEQARQAIQSNEPVEKFFVRVLPTTS